MNWLIMIFTATAWSTLVEGTYKPCSAEPERQRARSAELQTLQQADQADREDFFNKTPRELSELARKDEIRRKRVGEIFGEGCLTSAKDFSAAALIYQHGNVPEHFLQTFIWAKRAVEPGDEPQKSLMALGLDRYLVNSGHKQLFATQAFRPGEDPNTCHCLQPVEPTFPDTLRKQYTGKTVKDALTWLATLNEGKSCPQQECKINLHPTPKGTVPGFW